MRSDAHPRLTDTYGCSQAARAFDGDARAIRGTEAYKYVNFPTAEEQLLLRPGGEQPPEQGPAERSQDLPLVEAETAAPEAVRPGGQQHSDSRERMTSKYRCVAQLVRH